MAVQTAPTLTDSPLLSPSPNSEYIHQDILTFAQNASHHRIHSFYFVSPAAYASIFRVIFPDVHAEFLENRDIVDFLQRTEIQVYRPPILNLALQPENTEENEEAQAKDISFSYRHHTQLLVWLYDVSKQKKLSLNSVPSNELISDLTSEFIPREEEKFEAEKTHGNLYATLEEEVSMKQKRFDYLTQLLDEILRYARGSFETGKRREHIRKLLLSYF